MILQQIFTKFLVLETIVLADIYIDDELPDEELTVVPHDESFAKSYYEDLDHQTNPNISFISTTINIFHFDFLMNAYRSMTDYKRNYFMDQLEYEETNITNKLTKDKLIANRMVLLSYQSLINAVDNYLDILTATHFKYKKYDFRNKVLYVKRANEFVGKYVESPQKIITDNCAIGVIGVVGIQAKWTYPFKKEGSFMKAEGKFNFAHDMNFNIDILQIPFQGGQLMLTIVISRNEIYYTDAQRLFQMAFLGKFYVQIETVYLPHIAYSNIIKDYSHDREPSTKSINAYRCLSQKLVMNFNEEGMETTVKDIPSNKDWNTTDWKYGTDYYPPPNSCIVDSPFFFSITIINSNETLFLGRWRPSAGLYIEETITCSDDEF